MNQHLKQRLASFCNAPLAILLAVAVCVSFDSRPTHAEESFGKDAKRILFLGDSITHAGHYITLLETQMVMNYGRAPQMLNLGLPSETCSGLSEPAHPFPRPDVHERLDRALERVKADVVVVCYGMNDGIYYPFSEERFQAYQKGIEKLVEKVHASGAKLVVMTPPAFDPLPLKKAGKLKPAGAEEYAWFEIYEGYDEVLAKYSKWLMSREDKRVLMTIDLHSPVTAYVAEKRKANADFTMSPDGVHVNNEGHEVLAKAIAKAWGLPAVEAHSQVVTLFGKRQKLMHDAWLSHVEHQRPGVPAGLPLDEARQKAKELTEKIDASLR
jgi:lysophospholipase L1-like esterase